MGATRILTGFDEALAAGDYGSFSWGPFSGAVRINSIHLTFGDAVQTRRTMGLFVADTGDTPRGVAANPWEPPAGWTPLNTPSLHATSNDDERTAVFLPWQQATTAEAFELDSVGLVVRGDHFYLKGMLKTVYIILK